jgi:hypothetical protein
VNSIIDKGGIPKFVSLLNSKYPQVYQQAIWGLANIAGDHCTYRNIAIKMGAFERLIKILETTKDQYTIKNGIWCLSNFSRGNNPPPFK